MMEVINIREPLPPSDHNIFIIDYNYCNKQKVRTNFILK